eukprot:TRINITY_DN2832_c7_g1_i2.p2 TRINITY_DN2832_c7_g1~~TRINITY_DN2832_c7_g1_i2.p2  ORF type:complete len:113 (-),score=9.11 TRINITY_DN2832_c7_g1_i2:425-763(-)
MKEEGKNPFPFPEEENKMEFQIKPETLRKKKKKENPSMGRKGGYECPNHMFFLLLRHLACNAHSDLSHCSFFSSSPPPLFNTFTNQCKHVYDLGLKRKKPRVLHQAYFFPPQ